MAVLVSDYFIPAIFALVLFSLWFAGRDRVEREAHQRAVGISMTALGIANLAVQVINSVYFRPRPFVQYELDLLFYRPTDSSFPANPAALTFAIATGVWGGNRRVGAALYALAVLYGLSRVYAGVFYPSDILAGAAIGVVVALLVSKLFLLLEPLPTIVLRLARRLYLA
ncbi:MAG: phosphatase PAP2 family protein [Chloroflexi bacterium]|nr:phosphatase PAP2 family protein [Chloroflexota bacterium]